MCHPFEDGFVLEAWEETRLKDCWSSKQYWCIAKASIHPRSIFIGNFCHNNSDKRKLEQKCKCWQLTFIYWNQSYLLFENQILGVSVSPVLQCQNLWWPSLLFMDTATGSTWTSAITMANATVLATASQSKSKSFRKKKALFHSRADNLIPLEWKSKRGTV